MSTEPCLHLTACLVSAPGSTHYVHSVSLIKLHTLIPTSVLASEIHITVFLGMLQKDDDDSVKKCMEYEV